MSSIIATVVGVVAKHQGVLVVGIPLGLDNGEMRVQLVVVSPPITEQAWRDIRMGRGAHLMNGILRRDCVWIRPGEYEQSQAVIPLVFARAAADGKHFIDDKTHVRVLKTEDRQRDACFAEIKPGPARDYILRMSADDRDIEPDTLMGFRWRAGQPAPPNPTEDESRQKRGRVDSTGMDGAFDALMTCSADQLDELGDLLGGAEEEGYEAGHEAERVHEIILESQ